MRKPGRTWVKVVRSERTVEFHLVSAIPGSVFCKVMLVIPSASAVSIQVTKTKQRWLLEKDNLLWGISGPGFQGSIWVGGTGYIAGLALDHKTSGRRRETARLAMAYDRFIRSSPPSEAARQMLEDAVLEEWEASAFWTRVNELVAPAAEVYSVLES